MRQQSGGLRSDGCMRRTMAAAPACTGHASAGHHRWQKSPRKWAGHRHGTASVQDASTSRALRSTLPRLPGHNMHRLSIAAPHAPTPGSRRGPPEAATTSKQRRSACASRAYNGGHRTSPLELTRDEHSCIRATLGSVPRRRSSVCPGSTEVVCRSSSHEAMRSSPRSAKVSSIDGRRHQCQGSPARRGPLRCRSRLSLGDAVHVIDAGDVELEALAQRAAHRVRLPAREVGELLDRATGR